MLLLAMISQGKVRDQMSVGGGIKMTKQEDATSPTLMNTPKLTATQRRVTFENDLKTNRGLFCN